MLCRINELKGYVISVEDGEIGECSGSTYSVACAHDPGTTNLPLAVR
jgi:hypothetical protein